MRGALLPLKGVRHVEAPKPPPHFRRDKTAKLHVQRVRPGEAMRRPAAAAGSGEGACSVRQLSNWIT